MAAHTDRIGAPHEIRVSGRKAVVLRFVSCVCCWRAGFLRSLPFRGSRFWFQIQILQLSTQDIVGRDGKGRAVGGDLGRCLALLGSRKASCNYNPGGIILFMA